MWFFGINQKKKSLWRMNPISPAGHLFRKYFGSVPDDIKAICCQWVSLVHYHYIDIVSAFMSLNILVEFIGLMLLCCCVTVLLCYCVTVLLLLLSTFDDVEESAAYTASPAQCGATRRGGTTPTTTRWRPSPPSRGPRTNSPAWSWEPRPPSHPPQHVILSSRFTFSFVLSIKKL